MKKRRWKQNRRGRRLEQHLARLHMPFYTQTRWIVNKIQELILFYRMLSWCYSYYGIMDRWWEIKLSGYMPDFAFKKGRCLLSSIRSSKKIRWWCYVIRRSFPKFRISPFLSRISVRADLGQRLISWYLFDMRRKPSSSRIYLVQALKNDRVIISWREVTLVAFLVGFLVAFLVGNSKIVFKSDSSWFRLRFCLNLTSLWFLDPILILSLICILIWS